MEPTSLLAVDLGMQTGFAVFALAEGQVVLWSYRSTHVGSRSTLRRLVPSVLDEFGPLSHRVVEGDRDMAALWERGGQRRGAPTIRVSPEEWRQGAVLATGPHPLGDGEGGGTRDAGNSLAVQQGGCLSLVQRSVAVHDNGIGLHRTTLQLQTAAGAVSRRVRPRGERGLD